MKVCPSCKGQYDENMKFCRKCGVSLVTDKASTPNVIAKRHVYETKITQEPGNTNILVEYGNYLLSIGLIDEALIQYFSAIELKAEGETVRMRIVEAYHGDKQYDNAITQLLIIMEARQEDMPAKLFHGISEYLFLSSSDKFLIASPMISTLRTTAS